MKNKEIKILLSAPRGFCAGVERAIEIVKKSLKKYSKMAEFPNGIFGFGSLYQCNVRDDRVQTRISLCNSPQNTQTMPF